MHQASRSGPQMAVSRAAAAIAGLKSVSNTWAQVNTVTYDSWSPTQDESKKRQSRGHEGEEEEVAEHGT